MSKYGISIDLKKLKNAFFKNVTGKESTKRCICIPIEDNYIIEHEKGGVWLNISAFEYREKKFEDTHFLKLSIKKDVLDAMTEEERNNQPFIGGLRPFETKSFKNEISGSMELSKEETDDLPF